MAFPAAMKSPVLLVAVTLALAILLAASFLIATGTRGEEAPEQAPWAAVPVKAPTVPSVP
ncbi:hypothetical protein [Bradyrhizobium sp.]|uniref:hypothetical protein n=1 Tax=Bradyrhizobium sp. TaxID=376 RepID=UPI003C584B85